MSSLATNAITDASGGNTATINSYTPTVSNMAGRNRIINGDMRIDQRNAGTSITPTTGQYAVDRFFCYLSQASKYTVQQNAGSVTPPAGFKNYLGVTSSSAYSVTSTDYFAIAQGIEGYNIADFAWGTASAVPITISFWVRSSLTGTFGGYLTGGQLYPFSYTINAANTWEQKSVTIAGSTSGTWVTNNAAGVYVGFCLGAGSTYLGTAGSWGSTNYFGPTGQTSVVGTSGATFYITGVQLEAGSVATPFEHRMYGQELALCQRYYWKMAIAAVYQSVVLRPDWSRTFYIPFKQTMRAAPTATYTYDADGSAATSGTPALSADYFRMGTSASSTGGADPRLTAFDVSAEL